MFNPTDVCAHRVLNVRKALPTRGSTHPFRRMAVAVSVLALAGCATATPREAYQASLRQSGLDQTALGRDWAAAGARALETPLAMPMPLADSAYAAPTEPRALGYQLSLERGRRFVVEVSVDTSATARWFVELFHVDGPSPSRVAVIEEGLTRLEYEVPESGTYVLRLQPELLRGGRVTVVQRTEPTLLFPVADATTANVRSVFGDSRDAGGRHHEGVDIFAPRGRPVVAVADGRAQAGTNTLGGNVVWLVDSTRGFRYYYAHLEDWAAGDGATVRAGDVLGYVGNSGNAVTTPPHLHFGLYAGRAIDPLPFLSPADPVPAATPPGEHREWARVTTARATVRGSATLVRHTLVQPLAYAGNVVRIRLPDGTEGVVERSSLTLAPEPIGRRTLAAGSVLRERPFADAPVVETVTEPKPVDVLGQFGDYEFVRAAVGPPAWVVRTIGASP
jgi:murein DD-endopeptidase MepM/ murein hydrolase activator NlpD